MNVIVLKMRNTFVDVTSNIPLIQFNFGEQLTSIDEIIHLIAMKGVEEPPINRHKLSDSVINIGIV